MGNLRERISPGSHLMDLIINIIIMSLVIFVNLLTYFSASQSPSNGLTLCFLVTVFCPATTLTFSHSSFLFLTFVFSPWDFYSLGHKNKINNNNNSKTMFMVLSSWQSHCESSPGSFDECRMAPSGRRPKTEPDDFGCESACTGSTPTIAICYYYSARRLIIQIKNEWTELNFY